MNTRNVLVALSLVALGSTAAPLFAGPLNPPLGPVAPTGKTLSEVEPRIAINAANTPGDNDATPSLFKITQPGSYYLTGNITGVANKHGIEIASNNVSLDLGGYAIVGATGSLSGIHINSALQNIAVTNGTLRGWGEHGIFQDALGAGGRFERLHASDCTLTGISPGNSVLIRDCTSVNNGSHGFSGFTNCIFTNCVAIGNDASGFTATSASSFIECTSSQNGTNGFELAFANMRVQRCTAVGNVAGSGVHSTADRTVVLECSMVANGLDGIRVASRALLVGNLCNNNGATLAGGAGIHIVGVDCRVENNACSVNDRGIDVDSTSNIIIKNNCASNTTNWDIVANNVVGPIMDRRSPVSPAILGNAGASSLGTIDGNANFTH